MAEQHEPLPAHTLTSPIVLAAFLYGAACFFAAMASNGTQKLYDMELGAAMAQRDAVAADVEWRNAFWSGVASDHGPTTNASGLAKNVRRLFLDESRPGPEEMNAIIVDLRREAPHGNDHGILAADGSLTDASLTQAEAEGIKRPANGRAQRGSTGS